MDEPLIHSPVVRTSFAQHLKQEPLAPLRLGKGSGNEKLSKLERRIGKKIYTLTLRAGHDCPFAEDCRARAVVDDKGKAHLEDLSTEYRCYAASLQALRPTMREVGERNSRILHEACHRGVIVGATCLMEAFPSAAAVLRAHVAGDYFSYRYFKAMCLAADRCPELEIYGHTKSLEYVERALEMELIPPNMKLSLSVQKGQAAWATKLRLMAQAQGLKMACAYVLQPTAAQYSPMPVDHDDYLAYTAEEDYALVVHGTQPSRR